MADNGNQTGAQTQDSDEHKKSLKRSWKSSGPVAKLTVVFAGIAALSTTIYAIVAGGQLLVMRGQLHEVIRQYPEIQKSANAAKSAADTADATLKNQQRSFEIDERPYLVGQTPAFSGPPLAANTSIHINFTFKNIGRTPALKEFTYIILSPFRVPKGSLATKRATVRKFLADHMSQIREKESRFRSEISHIPEVRMDVAPGAESFTSNVGDDVILSTDEFTRLRRLYDNDIVLFALGLSTYTDAFGHPYETQYCWFYVGPDTNMWHVYEAYNVIQ